MRPSLPACLRARDLLATPGRARRPPTAWARGHGLAKVPNKPISVALGRKGCNTNTLRIYCLSQTPRTTKITKQTHLGRNCM